MCNLISFTRLYFCTLDCGRIKEGMKIKMCWRAVVLILGHPTFTLHNIECNRYKAIFSNQTKAQDRDFSKEFKTI